MNRQNDISITIDKKASNIVQRTGTRYLFQQEDMDYYFKWILGRQTNHGSEVGECFYAAAQIKDGDPASWRNAWMELAKSTELRAESYLSGGHIVSAREAYLRACTYYRAVVFICNPKEDIFKPSIQKFQTCFRAAASMFEVPVLKIGIPYNGRMLPGYYAKSEEDAQKRKSLIMIGGGETFAEDLYFYIAPPAIKRGYNVIMADLPGQGDNPFNGLTWEFHNEKPFRAIVDYAISLPEVDSGNLFAYGISGGGYFLGYAATLEDRVKAYVLNPPLMDLFRISQKRLKQDKNDVGKTFEAQSKWRHGQDPDYTPSFSPEQLVNIKQQMELLNWHPKDLKSPTLAIAGMGEEPDWIQMANEGFKQQVHEKKGLVLLPSDTGGDSHCQMDNISLMSATVFNWLDQFAD